MLHCNSEVGGNLCFWILLGDLTWSSAICGKISFKKTATGKLFPCHRGLGHQQQLQLCADLGAVPKGHLNNVTLSYFIIHALFTLTLPSDILPPATVDPVDVCTLKSGARKRNLQPNLLNFKFQNFKFKLLNGFF